MFLNVLYKTLKNDNHLPRTVAIVKRLLQVCMIQKAPFVCGTLFLLSEVRNSDISNISVMCA
jgi:ribosome biogenesis protein MAK21